MASKQKMASKRLAVAAAAGLASLAGSAFAYTIQPGDIVFGTASANPSGTGRIYAFDPYWTDGTFQGRLTLISDGFFNGVGGLGYAFDPNSDQQQLIVGTYNENTAASGRLYVVDPENTNVGGNYTQLGSGQIFNGVGDVIVTRDAFDQATNIYVSQRSANPSGSGRLYTADPTTGALTEVNTTPSAFNSGIGAMDMDGDDIVFGTTNENTSGASQLFSVDSSGGVATQVGSNPEIYFNSVTGMAVDPSNNNFVYVGTTTNQSVGVGHLYRVDRTTGGRTEIDLSQALATDGFFNGIGAVEADFFNDIIVGTAGENITAQLYQYDIGTDPGSPSLNPLLTGNVLGYNPSDFQGVSITSMIVGQPQTTFTGFHNITIDDDSRLLMSGNSTAQPNWFSIGNNAVMDITDLNTTLAGDGLVGTSSVRTANDLGGTPVGDGNLLLDTDLDYNDIGLFNGTAVKELTLRASNDLTISNQASITDSNTTASADSLALFLIGDNQRRPDRPGWNATGFVSVDGTVNVGPQGTLFVSGIDFQSTATIDAGGAIEMVLTNSVVIGNTLTTGSILAVTTTDFALQESIGLTAGSIDVNASGTITIGGGVNSTGNMSLTGGTVALNEGFLATDVVTVASFNSTGTTFSSTMPITTTTGDIVLDHTGAVVTDDGLAFLAGVGSFNSGGSILINQGVAGSSVNLNSNVTAAANFISSGTTFNNTAPISLPGTFTLIQSGNVDISGIIASPSQIDISGDNFTNTALINSTGAISLAMAGSTSIAGPVSAASLTSSGVNFESAAVINTTGVVNINHTGSVFVAGVVNADSGFTSTGASFDNFSAINTAGAFNLNHSGNATIGAPVTVPSSVSVVSDNFTNNALINTTGAMALTLNSDANINAPIEAGEFNSTGVAFTSIAAGTIDVVGDINLDHTDTITIGGKLDNAGDININQNIANGGSVQIDAQVGTSTPVNITSSGQNWNNTAAIFLSGDMTLNHTGNVAFDGPISLPTGVDVTAAGDFINTAVLNSTGAVSLALGGSATVDAAIDAASLTRTGGTSFVSTTNGVITTTGDVSLTQAGDVTIGGSVDADNFISSGAAFNNTAPISAARNVTIDGTGDITLDSTVDGNFDLSLNQNIANGASVYVNAPIGGNAAFANITGKGVDFNTTASITLTGDLSLDQTGNVVVGATIANPSSIDVTAQNFNNTATINSTGNINLSLVNDGTLGGPINAGSFNSTGVSLTVNAPVALAGIMDVDHTSSILVNSTINTPGAMLLNQDLGINGGGLVEINAPIGSITAPASLLSAGTTFNSTAPITLAGNLELEHSGQVTLGAPIETAGSVLVNQVAGELAPVEVNGTIGAVSPVASIAIDATTFANTASMNASGAVVLEVADSTLLNAPVVANSLTSGTAAGSFFNSTAAATIDLAAGDLNIDHLGPVSIAGEVNMNSGAQANISGSSFINTASFTGTSTALDITAINDGSVQIQAPVNVLTFVSTSNAIDGGTFNNTAGSTITTANGITLNHGGVNGDIDLAAALGVTGAGNVAITGNALTSVATGTVTTADGNLTATLSGPAVIGGAIDVGSGLNSNISVAAFSWTSAATVDATGSITIVSVDSIDVGADMTAGTGLSTQGTTFNTTAAVQVVTGDASLNQTGFVAINDEFDVDAGSLTIASAAASFTNTAPVTVAQNITIPVTGAVSVQDSVFAGGNLDSSGNTFENTVGGDINVTGNINLNYGDSLSVGDALTAGNGIQTVGSTFVNTAPVTATGGSVDMNQAGAVNFNSTLDVLSGDFKLTAGSTVDSTVAGAMTVSGSADINATGAVSLQGTANTGPLTITAPSISTASTAVVNTTGPILLTSGPISIKAPVTSTGVGSSLTATATTFDSTSTSLNISGLVDVQASSDITVSTVTAGESAVMNGTSITADGPLTTLAGDFNATATTGAMTASAPVSVTGGDMNVDAAADITTTDTVTVNGDMTTNAGSNINHTALISVTGGDLDATAGGNITASAGITVVGSISTDGVNLSTVGGTVDATGSITSLQSGTITTDALQSGTNTSLTGTDITTNGTVTTLAGPLTMDATAGGILSIESVSVTGGDMNTTATANAAFQNGVTVVGGNLNNTSVEYSSVGGAVDVSGSISLTQSGTVTTDDVTAGSTIDIFTSPTASITTQNVDAGGTVNLTGTSTTINGTFVADGTTTVSADGGAVDFNGNTTVTVGNFVVGGGASPATTFDSATPATTVSVAGNSTLNLANAITIDVLTTGENFAATSTASSFTSNGLEATAGTIDINAATGITLDSYINAGSDITLNTTAATLLNGPMTIASGSLSATGQNFDNSAGGTITINGGAGDVFFDQSGSVIISSDITTNGTAGTLSFAGSPTVVIDSAAQISIGNGSNGSIDYSGGAAVQQLSGADSITDNAFVGNTTDGSLIMLGDSSADITNMQVNNDMHVGGNAGNSLGSGDVFIGEFSQLCVNGTLFVHPNDRVRIADGVLCVGNIDDFGGQGTVEFLSGTLNFQCDLEVFILNPIANIIGYGDPKTIRVITDRVLEVECNTHLRSSMFLDGGTFSTATITMTAPDRLKFISGVFNLNKQELVVGNGGTLSDGVVSVDSGITINVNDVDNDGFGVNVQPGALLEVTGGLISSASGYTIDGRLNLSATSARVTGGAVFVGSGGRVDGDGTIEASINNTGLLVANRDEVLRFTGPNNVNQAGGQITLQNEGTMEFPQGLDNPGLISGDGVLRFGQLTSFDSSDVLGPVLRNDGTMNFPAKTDIFGDVKVFGGGASPKVTSTGGAVVSFFDDVVSYQFSRFQASSDSSIVYFGTLAGQYFLVGTGDHIIEGTESPGFSPAWAQAESRSFTGANSRAIAEIGGITQADAATESTDAAYDYFETVGTLTIGPDFVIELNLIEEGLGGEIFEPAIGDSFTMFTWGDLQFVNGASFETVESNIDYSNAQFAAGYKEWDVVWNSNSLEFVVVPEPTSAAMLGGAAMLLGLRRNRRHN